MTSNTFQVGLAEVTATGRGCVTIRCPFCRGQHRHDARAIGSREVVAGCSRGNALAKLYAIPRRQR